MENNIFENGYVMISRALLIKMCKEHPIASGNFEAFMRVLIYTNFKTSIVHYNGEDIECKRGESVISYVHWSQIFGWSRWKTRRFFQSCFADGTICQISDGCASHICIPSYDTWTGTKPAAEKGKSAIDALFLKFWEDYHEITHTSKINNQRAYRVWKKLSPHERELAVQNIDEYYHHLKNANFCPQAATYLKEKAFILEPEE